MKARLTKIERTDKNCWKLYFDFTEFGEENDKYMTADYFDKNRNPILTAKQVGSYNNKYDVYFGDLISEETFGQQISEYLKEL